MLPANIIPTGYISEQLWRHVCPKLRRQILRVLSRSDVVGHDVWEVFNLLRRYDEDELAYEFRQEVFDMLDWRREFGDWPPCDE